MSSSLIKSKTREVADGENVEFSLIVGGLGLSGAAALFYEVLWTRAFSLVIGSSVYALSTVLAAFLGGLAVGSLFGGRWANQTKRPVAVFAFLQLGIALSALFVLPLIQNLSPAYAWLYYRLNPTWNIFLIAQFIMVFLIILPATALMGATFPIASKSVIKEIDQIGIKVGDLYSANTLGAIFGALAAGFLVIPFFGLRTLNILAVCLNLGTGLMILVYARRGGVRLFAALALLILGISFLTLTVAVPIIGFNYNIADRFPSYAKFKSELANFEPLFSTDDVYGNVAVIRNKSTDNIFLVNNGKIEGSDKADLLNEALLADLPLAAHGAPETFLTIGLGSGTTLLEAGKWPGLASLTSVEINSNITEAVQRYFYPQLKDDARIKWVTSDARNFLLVNKSKYDVISSEPSYPTEASVSHLFTQDFFRLVKTRLNPGGVFAQWLPYFLFTDQETKVFLNTVATVFPIVDIYNVNGHDIILIARLERGKDPGIVIERVKSILPSDVLSDTFFYRRDSAEIIAEIRRAGLPVNSDNWPLLEFAAARNRVNFARPSSGRPGKSD